MQAASGAVRQYAMGTQAKHAVGIIEQSGLPLPPPLPEQHA